MNDKLYDVFLSHHSADKSVVKFLAQRLQTEGVKPFLDVWNLIPGDPWQEALEKALDSSATCAVFLGSHGFGPWATEEMRVALDLRAQGRLHRVFAVFLPGTSIESKDLPQFLKQYVWVDFRSGLEDSEAFRLLLCGVREKASGPPLLRDTLVENTSEREIRLPYRGIEPFETKHADLFFGRTSLIQRLVERLLSRQFLAVVGPSGSGKSSLVRAGLIPALVSKSTLGSNKWRILTLRPGPTPLDELAVRLLPTPTSPDLSHSAEVSRFSKAMHRDECALAAELQSITKSKTILIIDQFEELFAPLVSETERQAFYRNLLNASAPGFPDRNISVVLVLRADFFPRITIYRDLAERFEDHQIIVTPMQESDLWLAITQPAALFELRLEDRLVKALLKDMDGQPGALPLLQQALLELWKRRDGDLLTLAAYEEIHGVNGALVSWAESVFGYLSPSHQELARRVLIALAQPGEGMVETRCRLRQEDLSVAPKHSPEIEEVVEHLIRNRILTTGSSSLSNEKLLEISHEALLQEWPRLREWLEQSRIFRSISIHFQEQVKEWERLHKNPCNLLRGAALEEVERWNQEYVPELSSSQAQFLAASIENRAREAREQELLKKLLAQQGLILVYFNGVNSRGEYLTPPIPLRHIGNRSLQGLQTSPAENKGVLD